MAAEPVSHYESGDGSVYCSDCALKQPDGLVPIPAAGVSCSDFCDGCGCRIELSTGKTESDYGAQEA